MTNHLLAHSLLKGIVVTEERVRLLILIIGAPEDQGSAQHVIPLPLGVVPTSMAAAACQQRESCAPKPRRTDFSTQMGQQSSSSKGDQHMSGLANYPDSSVINA